jgi:hypothetical protein
MKNTMDGDKSLLDKTAIVWGSSMGDPNLHNHRRCPLILMGKANGALTGNIHVRAPQGTPMANALVSLMQGIGHDDFSQLGDSTGELPLSYILRNFVHVDDLVSAILAAINNERARQQLFNVCMNEPVDYGKIAEYLKRTRGLPSVEIPSDYHSTWLDNSKAKLLLGWRPEYDLEKMIDSAWNCRRSPNDPRKIWYPG